VIELVVRNRGRASIHVDDFAIRVNGGDRHRTRASDPPVAVPYELKAGASVTFEQSLSLLIARDRLGPAPYKVRGVVELGDGRTKWSRRRRLRIPDLD
jgi:hypothetical protein